jgi:hypothetical protein
MVTGPRRYQRMVTGDFLALRLVRRRRGGTRRPPDLRQLLQHEDRRSFDLERRRIDKRIGGHREVEVVGSGRQPRCLQIEEDGSLLIIWRFLSSNGY